jgi:hypothetical protein
MTSNFFTLRHLNGEEEFDWKGVLLNKYRCPTCDGYIPNNEKPGAYPGALSRIDNETEVCSACGTREALEMFFENPE